MVCIWQGMTIHSDILNSIHGLNDINDKVTFSYNLLEITLDIHALLVVIKVKS